jgi:hypothetical protein
MVAYMTVIRHLSTTPFAPQLTFVADSRAAHRVLATMQMGAIRGGCEVESIQHRRCHPIQIETMSRALLVDMRGRK